MSLNFFISSQFDASGHQAAMGALQQAQIKVSDLQRVYQQLGAAGGADVFTQGFTTEAIQSVDQMAQAGMRTAHALQLAAAAAAKAGDMKLSRVIQGMANDSKIAANELRNLASSEEAVVKGSKNLEVSAAGIGRELDKLNVRYKQLEEAQARYASTGRTEMLAGTNKAMAEVNKEISMYAQTLIKVHGIEVDVGKEADINHKEQIKNLTAEIKLLEKKILILRTEAVKLDDLGDKSGAAVNMMKADELEKTVRMFRKTRESVDQAHKGFLNFDSFLNSDFLKSMNKLGFVLFITKSSISTITSIITGMYSAMKQAATVIDKFRGAATVFSMHGFDGDEVRAKFMKAAGGAVNMEQAMDGAMQFMKAGQPQLAAQADELLEIARASAKLSGDLSKTAEIYDKLIRGVVRGSPKLIDDTGIVLKLGEANQKYAASINKTVEELTAADKIMATFLATIEGGKVIKEMADATESASEKFVKLEGALDNRRIALIVTAMNNLTTAFNGTNKGLDNFIEDLDHGTLIMTEFANIAHNFSEPVQKAANEAVIAVAGYSGELTKGQLAAAAAKGGVIDLANEIRVQRGETVLLTADMRSYVLAVHELEAAARAEYEAEQLRLENYEETSRAAQLNDMKLRAEAEAYDRVTEAVQRSIDKIRERIGIGPNVDLRGKDAGDNFQTILDNIQEAWKQSDRDQEIVDLETDLQEKLVEIDDKYADDRLKIQEDYKDDIAKMARETREAIEKERDDFNKAMTRMQQDLDKKLDDIHQKSLDKSSDTEEKHKKKMEDLEDDHQRKLNDIQRKYELARLKAIIDRDARALFEAEAKRAEDLAKAKEDAESKKNAELESVAQKRAEIEAEERKQTAAATAEFELRKSRMQEDYDDQINQMRENFQKQKAERNAQRKEQLDELREAWKTQKAEEQKRHDERLESMRKAWERERIESQRANFVREQERLMSLLRESEMTEEWMQQYIKSWRDFSDVLSGLEIEAPRIPMTAGTVFGEDGSNHTSRGGSRSSTSGPSSTSSPSPGSIIPGTSCSGMGSRGYTGHDGQVYLCWNGRWVLASSINSDEPVRGTGGTTSHYGQANQISGGNVTLNVQGDELVKGIIKDTTYQVIVDLYD